MKTGGKIGIIGAGLMGAGIAHVFAAKGFQVTVSDPMAEARATFFDRLVSTLNLVGLDPEIADQVTVEPDLSAATKDALIVFEAAPEKLELKQSIFEELDAIAAPQTILASNTSVIPISQISERVEHKSRMIGTHWWNPPFLIPLVEIVPIEETNLDVVTSTSVLLESVGKKPVLIKKDVPGFVGNRLQHALWREAHALIAEGICDAETVDLVVKNSFGMRLSVLGPIENADLVGLDLTRDIHQTMLPELSNRADPSPALLENIEAGRLGFKTGQGFLDWTAEDIAEVRETLSNHLLSMTQK